jgi:hypothetical protein
LVFLVLKGIKYKADKPATKCIGITKRAKFAGVGVPSGSVVSNAGKLLNNIKETPKNMYNK